MSRMLTIMRELGEKRVNENDGARLRSITEPSSRFQLCFSHLSDCRAGSPADTFLRTRAKLRNVTYFRYKGGLCAAADH